MKPSDMEPPWNFTCRQCVQIDIASMSFFKCIASQATGDQPCERWQEKLCPHFPKSILEGE